MWTIADATLLTGAVGALGTASYGLVDATKVFNGGISNFGFRFIKQALTPFEAALSQIDADDAYGTARANWINAVPKADQKLATRNQIRLGLTKANAATLTAQLPSINGSDFADAVTSINAGVALTEAQLNLLGRFDAIIDSRLDAAYERADQKFRNFARVAAGAIAIVLAVAGKATMLAVSPLEIPPADLAQALLVGLVAVPMAPIAKDVTSALTTAISAFKSSKS